MKITTLLLLALLTANTFASTMTDKAPAPIWFSLTSTTAPFDISTNGINFCKEAQAVINDVQLYNQTGVLTLSLEEKINTLKESNLELSVQEGIDQLIENAQEVLNYYSK